MEIQRWFEQGVYTMNSSLSCMLVRTMEHIPGGQWRFECRRPRRGSWYQFVAEELADGWVVSRCNTSADAPSDLQLFTRVTDPVTMVSIFNYETISSPITDDDS